MIAFIGSVFSPYYVASGRADPLDHAAMNLCLYGPAPRWTMTERGRADVVAETAALAIGPSAMRWDGDALVIDIDERTTPLPRRAVGSIRVVPTAFNSRSFGLDPDRLHVWRPPAPAARVEVRLTQPAVSWSGHGYLDMNWGAEPLENGFDAWNWSRSLLSDGSAVLYEGVRRGGAPFALALRFDRTGRAEEVAAPPPARLRPTNWLLPRRTRADAPGSRIVRTLEDTPFYARSVLSSRLFGEDAPTMHESVDLRRFASGWVQHLLPYRMPRRPLARSGSTG